MTSGFGLVFGRGRGLCAWRGETNVNKRKASKIVVEVLFRRIRPAFAGEPREELNPLVHCKSGSHKG